MIFAVLLTACTKEAEDVQEMLPKTSMPTLYHDILRFNSYHDLFNQIESLEEGNNSSINDFIVEVLGYSIDSNTVLSVDIINAVDEAIETQSFRGVGSSIGFENAFPGFISLRMKVEPLIQSFMMSGNDDMDPWLRYPYSEELKTIFNQYEEFIIRDTIYKFVNKGQTLIKMNVNQYNLLTDIRIDESLIYNNPNVIVFEEPKSNCKSFRNGFTIEQYNKNGSTYKLKTYCSVMGGFLTSTTNHYKVKNNGSLVWSIAKINTRFITTELYRNNCQTLATLNPYIVNGAGGKPKPLINWFHQTILIGDGVSFYFTPSQKTNSVSFCSTCSNSGLYLTAYAW